jgi:ABC-type cobalamin/Fe3+-siderophores transport system ATPase subunit
MHSQAHLTQRSVALEIRGLSKRFDRPAVDALDLTVYAGEFYALVGPNGAGKTTSLRMTVGLLRPDAGTITINGVDALKHPVDAKQVTAWLSDEPMIYDKLTPFEYLEFVAGLWGIDAARAEPASRPVSGSSSTIKRGSCTSAPASATFCFMPLEKPSQRACACGSSPSQPISSRAVRSARAASMPQRPATNSRYSVGVSLS